MLYNSLTNGEVRGDIFSVIFVEIKDKILSTPLR